MSNKPARDVQDFTILDPRVVRTTRALGAALIELIQEREFDDITVQQILDRSGVSRASFYAHYRNKEDVLSSTYDRLFARFDELCESPAMGSRLFPVTEFVAHVRDSGPVVDAVQRAGGQGVLELFRAYAARIIARRLPEREKSGPRIPRALAGQMLAGALIEMVEWWRSHPASSTPAEMDRTFHDLARGFCAPLCLDEKPPLMD
jgi:AcrR family transcriptional regulator